MGALSTFYGDAEEASQRLLQRGSHGVVQSIDDDGDANILFTMPDASTFSQPVYRSNLFKLRRCGQDDLRAFRFSGKQSFTTTRDGLVTEVFREGEAAEFGVEVGWWLYAIDSLPFTHQRLMR